MNKEFKFIYTCHDFARLWSGTVKLVGKEDTDAKKNALSYLHNQYKDSNCRIFSNYYKPQKIFKVRHKNTGWRG